MTVEGDELDAAPRFEGQVDPGPDFKILAAALLMESPSTRLRAVGAATLA